MRASFCSSGGKILQSPTLNPTYSQLPSLSPTPYPSIFPIPDPSREPTRLPIPKPSQRPTTYPSSLPTVPPSDIPTFLPSPLPTRLPSPVPTVHCNRGEFLNSFQECERCEVGRYSNISLPPWPRECTLCPIGKISPRRGRVADCEKCKVVSLYSLCSHRGYSYYVYCQVLLLDSLVVVVWLFSCI